MSCFATFFSQRGATWSETNYFAHPTEGQLDSIADIDYAAASKDVTPDNFAMTIQWLINGETHPTMPIRSTPEAWTQLVKSIGGHGQTQSSIGITLPEYLPCRNIRISLKKSYKRIKINIYVKQKASEIRFPISPCYTIAIRA